ncbi:hypothetical protein [Paractinoplanes brasiliensis]|uniref:Uncharacterized protein n=1 Tax=Paractinoplanes brasiliensis TaxID=52695 RepID=A0A4R6J7L3_9ACTN|nr:hypothetical protein [Actinoplanes brasiliensis]TDO31137.1 hypothetical protein C8E87_6547 [Actinoplanes brasiliensis]GID28548.1 hypothetical protein Abr02nite_35310 [Actinoplanes brasiliensis]
MCDELGPEPSPGLLLLHLPQLREVLREIEGLLEQWRESVGGSTMPVDARIDLVAGITRMLDAQQEAAAALVEVGEPTSGPARRLARAVEALAEIN